MERPRDLRDQLTITIHPPHPKHLHDPIPLKKLKNPNTHLTLTIPHLTYYLKQPSPLHKQPYHPPTSLYLLDPLIPIIPHPLSN
ncbi:RNB domain-containing ribonuclease, partial [Staphylococcus epidermidis]|uniref:RNB domain-containing ribonuclease n=1 Tax=Staphylococcus epidermidis TaxID=1282 RepID=UPI0037DA0B3E